MRRASRAGYAWISVVLLWIGIAVPSANADAIYQYTGSPFTQVCGFDCGDNAPPDLKSDYIIATISFATPLAPNMAFTDVTASLTGWTLGNALGYLSLSSANGDVLIATPELGPPMGLSTDSNGNIVDYVMVAYGMVSDVGIGITNPPYPDPQSVVPLAAFVEFGGSKPWDAATDVPGKWTKVSSIPEPSPLLLMSLSGVILILAKSLKHRTRPATPKHV